MCAAVLPVTPSGALIAVIGDEDTVTGFLLAGVGDRTAGSPNFLIVDGKTTIAQLEETFDSFTHRNDIAMILINQHVAEQIRYKLNQYQKSIPSVLEIPAKDMPYDENKDSVMRRVKQIMGRE